MKNFFIVLLGLVYTFAHTQSIANNAELPFNLEVEEVKGLTLPGLHSFAFGKWDRWWIFIGGRTNGLHGFFVATGFPEDEANINIILLDPITGEQKKFAVDQLTVQYKDALTSTNPQSTQDGKYLYITGGYGKDKQLNKFVTYATLTVVDLSVLVNKIVTNANPSEEFLQIASESMRVSGGEIEKLDDYFYLTGGHNFSGLYSDNGVPTFTQEYTHEIRKFKINQANNTLAITDATVIHDEKNLHRRDFSMAPVIQSSGKEGIGIYGGVFQPQAAFAS